MAADDRRVTLHRRPAPALVGTHRRQCQCRCVAAKGCTPRCEAVGMKPVPTLPDRDGLSPSYFWLQPGRWTCMIDFLCERFVGVPSETWRARMQRGEVRNHHGDALQPD